MAKEDKAKPIEYPDVPDKDDLKSFDLGIEEDHKGGFHNQISAYLFLIIILTLIITYYLST